MFTVNLTINHLGPDTSRDRVLSDLLLKETDDVTEVKRYYNEKIIHLLRVHDLIDDHTSWQHKMDVNNTLQTIESRQKAEAWDELMNHLVGSEITNIRINHLDPEESDELIITFVSPGQRTHHLGFPLQMGSLLKIGRKITDSLEAIDVEE